MLYIRMALHPFMNTLVVSATPLKPITIGFIQNRIRRLEVRVRSAYYRLDQVIEAMLQVKHVLLCDSIYKGALDAIVLQHDEFVLRLEIL